MAKETSEKVSIDPIDTVLSTFDKKFRKRVARYLVKSLKKKVKRIK